MVYNTKYCFIRFNIPYIFIYYLLLLYNYIISFTVHALNLFIGNRVFLNSTRMLWHLINNIWTVRVPLKLVHHNRAAFCTLTHIWHYFIHRYAKWLKNDLITCSEKTSLYNIYTNAIQDIIYLFKFGLRGREILILYFIDRVNAKDFNGLKMFIVGRYCASVWL